LTETAASVPRGAGRIVPLPADVTDEHTVERLAGRAERDVGPIDVLVNNAGSCGAIGPVSATNPHRWWHDVETNLLGTFLCVHAFLPRMLAAGSGTIINVASYAAVRPAPYQTAYGCAKAAVVHLTESLAAETMDSGVSVFAITPGTVRTDMTEYIIREAAERKLPTPLVSENWLSMNRVADLAVFLASGKADRLTGRFIHVLDDVADLLRRVDVIERDDLYVLRLRK
jgi:NAD(P)-dependent dehydrogenase (short-subunit alcohol dehydrogenase family)